jgi:hypothetical protein
VLVGVQVVARQLHRARGGESRRQCHSLNMISAS